MDGREMAAFIAVFNHLALPPRVPGRQDPGLVQIGHDILERLIKATRSIFILSGNLFTEEIDCLRRSLQSCQTLNEGGKLTASSLLNAFRSLRVNDVIILHVTEQNAGLLIHRRIDSNEGDRVLFETLEASPLSEHVLAATTLEFDFPGSSVSVPYQVYDNESFQNMLAGILEQASTEPLRHFTPRTQKQGSTVLESRETIDPGLITQALTYLLEANGTRVWPTILRKRVRDEVCWNEGAEKPWRRCPFWLVLRVAVQRQLSTALGGELGKLQYKLLMCQMTAQLLEDCSDIVEEYIKVLTKYQREEKKREPPRAPELELFVFLKTKLCRRVVKIKMEKEKVPQQIRQAYETMLALLEPYLVKVTKRATTLFEKSWELYKTTTVRVVPKLPRALGDRNVLYSGFDRPLVLSLPNSRRYLDKVFRSASVVPDPRYLGSFMLPDDFDPSNAVPKTISKYMAKYRKLSDTEWEIESSFEAVPSSLETCQEQSHSLSKKLKDYLSAVGNAYDQDPEQKSILLLTAMEIWMSLDQRATKLLPLLIQYDSGFPPDLLDTLQISSWKDMKRLQTIRLYLQARHASCNGSNLTIFHDPQKGCFAERYYQESHDAPEFRALHDRIERDAKTKWEQKKKECQKVNDEFRSLRDRAIGCSHIIVVDEETGRRICSGRCTKCYLHRQMRRMKIERHEHPLPTNATEAKAVIFELACPKDFLVYREATWTLIGTFAVSCQLQNDVPRMLLSEYAGLQYYTNHKQHPQHSLCLATVSKSFLDTHYHVEKKFPVNENELYQPNGMQFGYFDTNLKVWPMRRTFKPTFAHQCDLIVPQTSVLYSTLGSLGLNVNSQGPSSYQVIAHQTKCPSGLNIHEFTGTLSLFSGNTRRWAQIMTEIASSNLNFSSEATSQLICSLALQVGPASPENDHLGTVHRVFLDPSFCQTLLAQLDLRIEAITSNWRENNCMEMLITLLLRLDHLGSGNRSGVRKLIEKARQITLGWISALRQELRTAADTETSERCSKYALWAALLCRRTFAMHMGSQELFNSEACGAYLECSMALQDNLVGDPAKLSRILRNAVVRDVKMVGRMQAIIRQSLEISPKSLTTCVKMVFPDIGQNSNLRLNPPKFLMDHWVEMNVEYFNSGYWRQQLIHVHLLEGHLLITGKPIGRLPAVFRNSTIVKQIFGDRVLWAFHSHLPDMAHVLPDFISGHQIHFGLRNGEPVIRALFGGEVLELIPKEKFFSLLDGKAKSFDLPHALIDKCVHWLNLRTREIEIRQSPDIWRSTEANWRIDLNTSTAHQFRGYNTLVNPQSRIFQAIAGIFAHFESPHNIVVMQPRGYSLEVSLPRLELTFFVNANGWLECQQLRAEINNNQNVGTWYGLRSKIVLTEVINRHGEQVFVPPFPRRSIIVPMGALTYQRNGPHVSVFVENGGVYAIFTVNDILKRLDCQSEPRLFYLKAQYHAYTSFALADPLTGRSGTEEALRILDSGVCQPWSPLTENQSSPLKWIARLTPRRQYYPIHLKVMERISWDPHLTMGVQHDCFRVLVDAILKRSEELATFDLRGCQPPRIEVPTGDSHLTVRSQLRRELYRRPSSRFWETLLPIAKHVLYYPARHHWKDTRARQNVLEVVGLIRNWPLKLSTTLDLASIFNDRELIGGYTKTFDSPLLGDVLDLDIVANWGSLVNFCRSFQFENRYNLMFLLGIAAFSHSEPEDMQLMRTLIAYAILSDLKKIQQPEWPVYTNFRYCSVPTIPKLTELIQPHLNPYREEESVSTGLFANQMRKKLRLAEEKFLRKQKTDLASMVEFLLSQWPCEVPTIDGFAIEDIELNVSDALEVVRSEWLLMFQNSHLSHHLTEVQLVLTRQHPATSQKGPVAELKQPAQEMFPMRVREEEFPTVIDLFRESYCPCGDESQQILKGQLLNERSRIDLNNHGSGPTPASTLPLFSEILQLNNMVQIHLSSKSAVRRQYGEDLSQSIEALRTIFDNPPGTQNLRPAAFALARSISEAQSEVTRKLGILLSSFETANPTAQWLQAGGLWPCYSPQSLLENLRSVSETVFGNGMKEALVAYALSITNLQRLLRMDVAYQQRNEQKLMEELDHIGHSNWEPLHQSDWLLLEIDANLLIRPGQVDVAMATISPFSKSNSVLQMNMGQGKTSCIIPMVAAVLADKQRLMRVIVPKALLHQTAQLMHLRLGGLLGRTIAHVPFSRSTRTDEALLDRFSSIHRSLKTSAGVVLALPEHMLSFKLSGLQQLSDGHLATAQQMTQIQSWMSQTSRDVIDEADSILAIRTQLIYPSGTQKTVDGHPKRWEVPEVLFRSIYSHLPHLQQCFPHSIEIVHRYYYNALPIIYFLRKDAEDELLSRLVDDVCYCRIPILPASTSRSDLCSIKQFISEERVTQELKESIERLYPDRPELKQVVYLLRGLIVHRILLMALKKRWNVQYGLHPNREPIAVPYTAKGKPSEQAEWGHPDVAILFTCLAFYYQGLNESQLRQALEHVLKSDDPSQAYDCFTRYSHLPFSLRDWNAINLDDESQLRDIWQELRWSVDVIDYYLNNLVFPRFAKQFHMKLQASGWDIPSFHATNQHELTRELASLQDRTLTTGFSGTNDWKRMLPLTIRQNDLPGLSHTNAEVLAYLLQPRNREFILAADFTWETRGWIRYTEHKLLQRISHPALDGTRIRVLIDAGAQILEMDNLQLVKAWLEIDTDAAAAVYFDENNRACVCSRRGKILPLLASTFAEDLSQCLVYLDEAHTRGTDLKLPPFAIGALTLGPGQTKDHTVQAAMRLRQLGTTQSVKFFGPPEVYQSILDLQQKQYGDIDSYDVLCWLLEQTCIGIEQLQPLYYAQGGEFCRRMQAALNNSDFLINSKQLTAYLSSLRQIEQHSLAQLYGVGGKKRPLKEITSSSSQIAPFLRELESRRRGFQDSGGAVHGSALQEVEQEREVAHEVEAVREVQKPVHYTALRFPPIHRDVLSFAKTGRLTADSAGYQLAFNALGRTSVGAKFNVSSKATSGKLYVSTEFTRTIKLPPGRSLDNFQRPVNWIIWSKVSQAALIIIPEEAEVLLPILSSLEDSPTHLLVYAAPVTRKMLHFSDLDFYAVPGLPKNWVAPAWLKVELGIYAGRLYFEFGEYQAILDFLGIRYTDGRIEAEDDDSDDDFVPGVEVISPEAPQVFTRKPLAFLQEWLALRRKGQNFDQTPMGYVCQGKILPESHHFFASVEISVEPLKQEDGGYRGPVSILPKIEDKKVEEEMFEQEAHGDRVNPDELEAFDEAQLHIVEDVEEVGEVITNGHDD